MATNWKYLYSEDKAECSSEKPIATCQNTWCDNPENHIHIPAAGKGHSLLHKVTLIKKPLVIPSHENRDKETRIFIVLIFTVVDAQEEPWQQAVVCLNPVHTNGEAH